MGIAEIRNIKKAAALRGPRKKLINGVSEKRKVEEKEYLKIKAEVLKKHPVCQFPGCNKKSVDTHHSEGRNGKNYLNKKKLKALCRAHHIFCELNPKLAKTMNLSKSRLIKTA